jgi:tetratricopeptide (TPR) repeat protein
LKDFLSAMKFFPRRHFTVMILVTAAWVAASCAPRPPYRMPPPPAGSAPTISRAPQPAPPPTEESFRRPVPQEGKIREQDLKSKGNLPSSSAKEKSRETSLGENRAAEPVTPPLADDSSLLAKITPATPPQRAASLRLTEEGRKLLDAGDPQKALGRLEKTIVVDSTNPYGYFFLAKAQYRLGRYKESLNFLDVTESQLSNKEPYWLAEVQALRGENYRALGMMQQAEASYAQALRLNSGNRTAAEAMSRLQGDGQPASR